MTIEALVELGVYFAVCLLALIGCANVLVWLAERLDFVEPPLGEHDPDDFNAYMRRETERHD